MPGVARRSRGGKGGYCIGRGWGKGGYGYRVGRSPFYSRSIGVSSTPKGALRGAIPNVRPRVSSPHNYPLYGLTSYNRSKGYTPGISP